jgi:hypothetical protein
VAQDKWSPAEDVVEVGVTVGIGHTGSLAADDDRGLSADGAESADGRVDAAGEKGLGALLQLMGAIKFS